MSERIVDNPANHGWVEDNGKWVWEGGATTGHIEDGTVQGQITTWDVAKTEWTPEGSVKVSADTLQVEGNFQSRGDGIFLTDTTFGAQLQVWSDSTPSHAYSFGTSLPGINTDGSLHIGGYAPGAGWQDRLTIDSTGNATFSGTVNAPTFATGTAVITTRNISGLNGAGFLNSATDTGVILSNNGATLGPTEDNARSLGAATLRFKDAYFSGTVNAGKLDSPFWFRSGQVGLVLSSSDGVQPVKALYPADGTGALADGALGLGSERFKFTDAHFSGTVNAQDHVASSDERLKDNITTAPVGLIDSLKGREWEWKESGEKGSGVVAQELEEVLPHLVHTDDEGMKSVSYMGLCAYLIEEVKALRAEVEALKNG